ncbi:MAG: type II toxin-antitoxin system RelE/ParE family toxin [Candidatus Buchananbacteria bacterium]|nr:type II toxin-antitoxin system RelE/ParE family toxin [Candidatus Buchananbacteria bacterium]
MTFRLEYAHRAIADLRQLDEIEAKRIVAKIKYFMAQESPLQFAQPLAGIFKGQYRFRIGNYRAIFNKDTKGKLTLLTVIAISHRKEIYRS